MNDDASYGRERSVRDGGARRNWHALKPKAVVDRLHADLHRGLDGAEARRRLAVYGPNQIKPIAPESVWEVFLELIREPLMLVLLGIGVLYSIWGGLEDALTIVAIVGIMVGAEVFNDYRSSKTIAGLSKLAEPTARVLRAGAEEEVAASSVVPGDVLILTAGHRIPADARLVMAFGLSVDESAMTGEPVPVDKDPGATIAANAGLAERMNMAYAGTLPVRGRAIAVAVETGTRTELGRIAATTAEIEEPKTPLQKTIAELSRWMVFLALAVSALVPILGVVLTHQPIERMILTGLSLVFAMIPEELPLIITTILAIGCYRLAKRGALTKRMAAAETLGEVSVIVTDKTGTLTQGRLSLSEIQPVANRDHVLELAALTASAEMAAASDPFDVAFLDAAAGSSIDVASLRKANRLLEEFPFDPGRKRMSVVRQCGEGFHIVARGAPEAVLAACDLSVKDRERRGATADTLAGSGLRVLALAEKTVSSAPTDASEAESNLVFGGLAAFVDPTRAEVPRAIAACMQAGIRVLMVTGDHPETAAAVAKKVGIKADQLLLGPDVERMSDDQLAAALLRSPIMARFTPTLKQRVVAVLEKHGEFVAVTGDGINDAPALALAHIGVAMGKRGTDVAREAADIVLADDNFSTVERAVEEGRVIHANLRKGIRFYLAFKLALIGATLVPVLLLLPVAFAPIQIILTEFFMDVGGSTSFVAEPPEQGVMRGRSHDPRTPFMDSSMLKGILTGALGASLAVILSYVLALRTGQGTAVAQTMAFVTLLIATALLATSMRSEKEPLFKLGLVSNLPMVIWATAIVTFALIVVLVPPVHGMFKTVALTVPQWVLVLVLAVAGTMWAEIVKLMRSMGAARSVRRRMPSQVS